MKVMIIRTIQRQFLILHNGDNELINEQPELLSIENSKKYASKCYTDDLL